MKEYVRRVKATVEDSWTDKEEPGEGSTKDANASAE